LVNLVLASFWTLLTVAELYLVVVHGPTGQSIYVNIHEITSLREPLAVNRHHVAKGVNCVIFMTNGNLVGAAETCENIRQQILTVVR
jgi:hypothetical protein